MFHNSCTIKPFKNPNNDKEKVTAIVKKSLLIALVPPESVTMFDSNKPTGYSQDEDVTVTQGRNHAMKCFTSATLPASTFTWTFQNSELTSSGQRTTDQYQEDDRLLDTTSTMTFNPQRSHHNRYLKCDAVISVANIGDFPSPSISTQVILKVYGK